ncbi:FMN-binding negative transcriptional regulator [Phaeobacter gallaeciensis]|jgi:transcriptional regulator|uniref:FMN-binding negative transcriptional regulator n=1 Tax=Phaeobacter gallaeciensis TaxID=60890 RepID=UPI00237F5779|nr:FMN-binding negative transcriptional regulator [Phaeobacter gallaeciensis]MDE4304991.1 FMN-binding negative transcriptional regulator [Phaeobacter gallaeciensis]MDE4309339.1 FMN-binding negative transcriptional regulator [Phaeobacter gallaeciensis]MDE4313796.1 FMN-binding negative transcriptional regulator [Phaeobacter gallaeciensis]MDE4318226.1 FMN-binding negative transcriptional regulator [Phaeobacter gallaeciensis]MDE4323282.1 FMN-binding negative transcriptional regulator [Phaeobacter 
MHPNPIYHDADRAQNLDFARTRAFGVLAVSTTEAPLISHVPFLLSEDGTSADLHLVRSNPISRMLKTPQPARLAVSGPDGYVSPDWYGLADQVPTWNYVAVHLTGRLEQRPQDELLGLLDRQSAFYEARLLPKPPWHSDKMEPEALERLMRMIVPVRLSIETVEGTWKLNQNKPEPARTAVADQITTGFGAELDDLARMMRS